MTIVLVVALGVAGVGLLVRAMLRIRREERRRAEAVDFWRGMGVGVEAERRAAEAAAKQLGDAYRAVEANPDDIDTLVACRNCWKAVRECRCPKVLIGWEGQA